MVDKVIKQRLQNFMPLIQEIIKIPSYIYIKKKKKILLLKCPKKFINTILFTHRISESFVHIYGKPSET